MHARRVTVGPASRLRLLPARAMRHHRPRTQIIGCASSGEATPMPKVLIIQPFHEDGMKLFAARPDVS